MYKGSEIFTKLAAYVPFVNHLGQVFKLHLLALLEVNEVNEGDTKLIKHTGPERVAFKVHDAEPANLSLLDLNRNIVASARGHFVGQERLCPSGTAPQQYSRETDYVSPELLRS